MNDMLIPPSAGWYDEKHLVEWMDYHRQRLGDIYRGFVYGGEAYIVSHPRYVEHVLRTHWRRYTKGLAVKRVNLLLGRGLISSEGAFWKSQRRMIQPAFHPDVIGQMTKVIIDTNVALLKRWELAAKQADDINITQDLSTMVLETVLRLIFGDDYQQVAPYFNVLTTDSARNLEFAQMFRPLRKIVTDVAAQRRAERRPPSLDFLGLLITARDRSGTTMPDGQLTTEIMTLIVAGHETTALVLNWTWYLLAQNPDVQDKLIETLDHLGEQLPDFSTLQQHIGPILDEAMRLYPPVWLITRRAIQDDVLDGFVVPAGTEIYLSPYLIQRHPDLWQHPERFDPSRSTEMRHPLATLPFSAGPRNCIGEGLARIEMQLHLAIIAKKIRMHYRNKRPLELAFEVNLRNEFDFIMTATVAQSKPSSRGRKRQSTSTIDV